MRNTVPARTFVSRDSCVLHMILVGAILGTATQTIDAQTVTGVVKDAGSGTPVADASVVLLDDKEKIQRGTLTELDGSFTITAPKAGTYSLRVGAAGYNTTDAPQFELEDGQTSDIDILLASATETGPPGFAARRSRGEGEFLTREEIHQAGSGELTEVLRFVPGVTVVPLPQAGDNATRPPTIANQVPRENIRDSSEAARGGRAAYNTIRIKPDRATAGVRFSGEEAPDCVPVLWVDGQWWGPIDEASDGGIDGKFLPTDIEAIEIYNHPSILPDQFNSGKDAMDCGVVVLWLVKKE
jgi:hypothetical protein